MATYTFYFNPNPPDGSTGSTTETEVEINEFPYLFVYRAKSFNWTYTGYKFVKWNDAADGSGTSLYYGDEFDQSEMSSITNKTWYAIWEEDFTYYLTTDVEFGQVADAIRTKGGTSASLAFPTGFVSAINAIPTGGSSYTLLATQEFNVSTTSTSVAIVGNVSLPLDAWTAGKLLYARVRDKAGARPGYFVGSDTFFLNDSAANGFSTTPSGVVRLTIACDEAASSPWKTSTGTGTAGSGVFARSLVKSQTDFSVSIYSKYNDVASLTIDGTYVVKVYLLNWPDGISPFA